MILNLKVFFSSKIIVSFLINEIISNFVFVCEENMREETLNSNPLEALKVKYFRSIKIKAPAGDGHVGSCRRNQILIAETNNGKRSLGHTLEVAWITFFIISSPLAFAGMKDLIIKLQLKAIEQSTVYVFIRSIPIVRQDDQTRSLYGATTL